MTGIYIAVSALFFLSSIYTVVKFKRQKAEPEFKSSVSAVVAYGAVFSAFLFGVRISYYALYLTLAALAAHIFVGFCLGAYDKSRIFDRYLHSYSTFSFALLFYYIIGNFVAYGGDKLFRALFILTLGISLGAVYEVIEFVSDSRNDYGLQRGLKDTNFDLVFDLLGSVCAALCAYLFIL